jgi:hypothetical protein
MKRLWMAYDNSRCGNAELCPLKDKCLRWRVQEWDRKYPPYKDLPYSDYEPGEGCPGFTEIDGHWREGP